MKLSKNSISISGEFAVLSQLALRGIDANLTLGNTKSVDILASDPISGKMYKLEVKTCYNNKPSYTKLFGHTLGWVMSEKHENITDPSLFYCFVNIEKEANSFRFFIVPSDVVAKYVKEQHQFWLNRSQGGHKNISISKSTTGTAITTTTPSPTWCYCTVTAMMKSTGRSARDKSLLSEEPDEVKVSCPVRKWRWGGQLPHRP